MNSDKKRTCSPAGLSRIVTICLALFLTATTVSAADPVSIWPVDIHQKIFPDSQAEKSAPLKLSAAQNEFESAQFAIRSKTALNDLTFAPVTLIHEDGQTKMDVNNIRIRPIGYIPIAINTPGAEKVVVRKAPCEVPDVLLDDSTLALTANRTQGIWVTVFVPKNAKPGLYKGSVSINVNKTKCDIPVELNVFPFALPDKRNLYITNWWFPDKIENRYKVKKWSPEYWKLMDLYFKNMADHRQNVILLRWLPAENGNVKATRLSDGTWTFDFSKFEQFLKLAEKNGVADRIELGHAGGINRKTGTINLQNASVYDEKSKKFISVPADVWLKPTLTQLRDYLKKTGRLDRSMIHVADEPFMNEINSWRKASEQIRNIAPELKQIDAIETINFSNRLDVWVPKLTHFDRWRDAYENRRSDGEFWYYICCHPIGPHYPNRFMDLPGTRIRVLHWINFTENLSGYLHWGLNYWSNDPFGAPTKQYGPGDTHTIYPGKSGPLDSIRWELERESVEDFEYLTLLTNLTKNVKNDLGENGWWLVPDNRSKEIGRRIIPDLAHSEMDEKKIEQARLDLASEINAAQNSPRLIVQTYPADHSVLYAGPSVVELYGITTPGAKVMINDTGVSVSKDGQFKHSIWAQKGELKFEIKATLGDKTTKTVRYFTSK